ncbi:PREDICTED: piggyBac transposable element-derived protein 2-like [Rhagoletis zephyria]|nr:PREDICTED: piggyBac transposable element-derived protein 2-like [Rhagoletis zephyria]
MKKKATARGSYEYCFERNKEIYVVRWKDSSVATVMSNHNSHEPLTKAKRFNHETKKFIWLP